MQHITDGNSSCATTIYEIVAKYFHTMKHHNHSSDMKHSFDGSDCEVRRIGEEYASA